MGQEVARMNARGYYDGSGGGTYIGMPVPYHPIDNT